MNSNTKITAIVAAALAALGLAWYFRPSTEERQEFLQGLKAKIHELIDDAEGTSHRAKTYLAELKSTAEHNWLDKLVVMKKIIDELKPVKEAGNKFGQAANRANATQNAPQYSGV